MYKLLLILKYLRKRRIAWVSLVAVMLCTAMVLVVISIMGGWLRMFRDQFKGVSGDIIVDARSMVGFPGYEDMLVDIRKLPEVKAAAPIIYTYGLININNWRRDGVMVYGYPPEIQEVNSFRDSCYLMGGNIQGTLIAEKLKDKILASPDPEKAAAAADAVEQLYMAAQMGVVSGKKYYRLTPIGSEIARRYLTKMPDATAQVRIRAVDDDDGRLQLTEGCIQIEAISSSTKTAFHLWPDSSYLAPPGYKGKDPRTWDAMVVGSGVVGIRKDQHGVIKRPPGLYGFTVDLTVVPMNPESTGLDLTDKARRYYWIIDDSRTKVHVQDAKSVYVAFDLLQQDLQMDAHDGLPARCTSIQIALKDGATADRVVDRVRQIVDGVITRNKINPMRYPVDVRTWEQQHAMFIGAVEKEKFLVTFLFGIISIVAIFLIFCIFYMIVVEKTRDIGIIKSVGATSAGIAGIFLGYGLAIGIVGAGIGLGLAWFIVHYINQIHDLLGRWLGLVVWNPEVYLFDTIPNTMNPPEVIIIMAVAIAASVLGALVPAIRAAQLHPVEALRWE